MKFCVHPNCNSVVFSDGLCKYHKKEFENNGKEGHWLCSWCTEYKQATEDMIRSRFDYE